MERRVYFRYSLKDTVYHDGEGMVAGAGAGWSYSHTQEAENEQKTFPQWLNSSSEAPSPKDSAAFPKQCHHWGSGIQTSEPTGDISHPKPRGSKRKDPQRQGFTSKEPLYFI